MSEKHAEWIEDLLGSVLENPTEENIRLIESCGKACGAHKGNLEGMLELKKSAKDCKTTEDYIKFLKTMMPIEECENGFIMALDKEECTCEMAPEIHKNKEALCYCTQGHERALWSTFFGKPVDVELLETVNRGGNTCVIKVTIEGNE